MNIYEVLPVGERIKGNPYVGRGIVIGKTENGKKVLDSSLEEIELEEHSVTMNNNKATDTKTNNKYKINNASGKAYNFGEFRHL